MGHRILFRWERRPKEPAAARLRSLIIAALGALDVPQAELHVMITDDPTIRDLNRRYRDLDRPTDVLSFPDGDRLPDGRTHLGEIVVSLETAREQAERLGHPEVRELEELVLHGLLHVLGYDHTEDEGDMDRMEMRLRRDLLG